MSDKGQWQPTPFYDVTFSPTAYGEHIMAYGGYGSQPPLKVIQKLATQANYGSWAEARKDIEQICDALAQWPEIASELEISADTKKNVSKKLDEIYRENKGLLR